jgi:hypothetical protein
MNREDLLLKQHESVAEAENKLMRQAFKINKYAEGVTAWDAHQARKITGALGGRGNVRKRPWAEKPKVSNGE